MNQLVFASANVNKVREVEKKLGGVFPILGLTDIGCVKEIPETMPTIEGNARQKAWYVWDNYHINCFADDTGLEVTSLNNEPGVFSARYAGEQRNNEDNINLVLDRLKNIQNRSARFRTVICLILNGEEYLFEGIAKGNILDKPRGNDGFGYDSVFVPENSNRTFAEMNMDEKNVISHRGKAIQLLAEFLHQRFAQNDDRVPIPS